MDTQEILVYALFGIAFVYLVYRIYKKYFSKKVSSNGCASTESGSACDCHPL
ncbi:MAG: hypothetical protein WDZ35_13020 [Crocinitomicaceae bacterium]